jgi:hypothetical protein
MKKIILFLILSVNPYAFGQTYTMKGSLISSPGASSGGTYTASYRGNGASDVFDSKFGFNVNSIKTYTDVSLRNTSFSLYLSSTISGFTTCTFVDSKTVTVSDLILNGFSGFGGCLGSVNLSDFKPNLTIQKRDRTSNELCSGASIDLEGFPAGFPKEAYHWQYSLDNRTTWIDVPIGLNDNSKPNFTMKDLLGDNHVNYWNENNNTIYFRLGYGQNRPFTSPIAITYSPCAPTVKELLYNVKCNGSAGDLIITFNRDLLKEQGEYLERIFIIDKQKPNENIASSPPGSITAFNGSEPNKTFTITDVSGLKQGITYSVKYQAFLGTIARGLITTDKTFTLKEPAALKFTATAINPLCDNDPAKIAISATGGTPPYFYILDNDAPIEFTSPIEVPITGLLTVPRNIKVIDKNSCTEK